MNKIKDFNEQWYRWDPVFGVKGNYYVQKILDEDGAFKFILNNKEQNQIVEVAFPQTIAAIRIADEGVVFMLFDRLSSKYGEDFYANWAFFKVENSDCLRWLSGGTAGFSEKYELTHYVIKGLDLVIDVVTRHAPIVRLVP